MTISVLNNSEFVDAVEDNLENSVYRDYVGIIIDKISSLGQYPVYLWGGFVRNPIIKVVHGRDCVSRDIDIIVDDTTGIELKAVMDGLSDVYCNRFGCPKWRPENGLEVDVSRFSNASRLRNGEDLPVSLTTSLDSCEFTTGAIAFGFHDRTVYDNGVLEVIQKEEIDLLYEKGEESHVLMCRIVLQSDELGFRIGKRGKKLIYEKYNPDFDPHIRRYMEYKGIEDRYQFVIESLRKLHVNPE